jgi:hypothetical protein
VRRQHERGPDGHVGDVVDEHDAELTEAVDHQAVVDDLVVAVHRRLERPDHPRQRLDRHLHTGAEAARRSEQDLVDSHGPTLPAPLGRADGPGRPCARSLAPMSAPRVVAVAPGSPAQQAGLVPGDEVVMVSGRSPRDVIEWRVLVDEADPELEVRTGGLERTVVVAKRAGEPLGAEVSSSLFDQVRTCDNHCEFCFIYQLPPACGPACT